LWLTPLILTAWETEIRRLKFEASPEHIKFLRLQLQNNLSKMDWRCGSSGKAPVLEV
jgi:hypothetical protein